MNYRHLEVFYAVMTSGTVTEAARRLGVSQPSVTTTLKQAERKLGFRLFHREGGRLSPTPEARELFEEAERAHEALASFDLLANRLRQGRGGELRIAAIPSVSLELLPDAIRRFRTREPDYSFSLSSLNTEEILSRLDERFGSFHVGITLGSVFESHVSTETIGAAEVFAVFPSAWSLPDWNDISLADIADRPFISGFDGTAVTVVCTDLFRDAGVEAQIVARSHSYHLAGRLVEQGVGYALLDSVTVRALLHDRDSGQLTVRRLIGKPQLPVTVILPGRRTTHRAVRPFIDSVQEAYEALSGTIEARLP